MTPNCLIQYLSDIFIACCSVCRSRSVGLIGLIFTSSCCFEHPRYIMLGVNLISTYKVPAKILNSGEFYFSFLEAQQPREVHVGDVINASVKHNVTAEQLLSQIVGRITK
nr:unnamed protein product [Fasciola hepatica]